MEAALSVCQAWSASRGQLSSKLLQYTIHAPQHDKTEPGATIVAPSEAAGLLCRVPTTRAPHSASVAATLRHHRQQCCAIGDCHPLLMRQPRCWEHSDCNCVPRATLHEGTHNVGLTIPRCRLTLGSYDVPCATTSRSVLIACCAHDAP